jgi:hypothetical protein
MSKQGMEFLESWMAEHITEGIKQSVDGAGASLSVELVERLIADAEKAGLALADLGPELGQLKVLIREALESDAFHIIEMSLG